MSLAQIWSSTEGGRPYCRAADAAKSVEKGRDGNAERRLNCRSAPIGLTTFGAVRWVALGDNRRYLPPVTPTWRVR
jgi:hypothetical protein